MRPAPLPTRSGLPHGSLRRRLAQTTAIAALLAAVPALGQTLPDASDGLVTFGVADITKTSDGNTLTISTATPRTVIDWSSFNVGATIESDGTVTRQTANFTKAIDPDTGLPILTLGGAVLNRVVGNDGPGTISPSRILGNLISDPDIAVYLLNPRGVLFGANARVNVGSLVASTLETDPALFFAGAPLTLQGASTDAIETLEGSQINAIAAERGIVALVSAQIDTRGALTATGEVALVAASDTTISFDSASPLSVVIRQGSPLTNPIVARNTITGSSILLAGATRTGVNEGLLDVQATLTATSAYATDRGIVLAAGPTATTNAGVTFAAGRGTDNAGPMALTLGGTLTATGAGAAIDVRSLGGVGAPASPAAAAVLIGEAAVLVRADAGGVALGDVTSRLVSATDRGIDMSAGTGAITAGAVAARVAGPGSGGANASVVASAGTVTLGSLVAGQSATVSGSAVTAGSIGAEAGTLDVAATAGAITADTLASAGRLAATATGGNLVADSASSSGSGADLVVRATNVLGRTAARAGLSAGRDLDLVATGTATLGTAAAGRAASLRATVIDATALTAGTTLGATATTGALSVVGTSAGGTATLQAAARATLSGSASAGGDLLVTGTEVRLGGVTGAQHVAQGTASYTATAGTIALATAVPLIIRADAGGGATGAVILDANTGIDLPGVGIATGVPGGVVNTGDVGIRLVAAGAPLTLGTVDADALLSVNAAHTGFSPLTLGGAVTLGATRLADSLALSTPGTITLAGIAIGDSGQSLSVIGTGAATTITSAGALSALAGVSVTASGAVSLAGVAGGSGTAAIESTGAGLSAGAVTGGIVSARARNALSLASVIASTGAATLVSTTAGITVTGATQGEGAVTIDAPGAIALTGGVRSTGGTIAFQSTGGPATGAITAGPVRAFTGLTVSRAAGLTFASATSDTGLIWLSAPGGIVAVTGATTAATSVAMSGASLALGGAVTAGNGAASLTATSGGITVGGPVLASGTVTLDAPGTIDVDDVRSTGATVLFRSTALPATGTISAGAVRAATDLSVSRAGGLTFDSATSDTGAVSLASVGSLVTVTGATTAATSVAISGANAALGSVTAGTTATVAATNGIAASGPILAGGAVTIDAPGTVTLRDVRSTGASVTFQSTAGPATGAITAGAVRGFTGLAVSRSAPLTFASATSDTGAVSLTATGANVEVTDAVGASTSVAVTGAAVRLGSVAAGTGTATLTATTGGIAVAGATTAAGNVTLDAPGAIALGDVRSTAGTVVFRSTALPVTGAVSALDVRAATDLSVARAAGVSFRSATSDTGAVSLASAGGTVSVTGATTAATNVAVGANAVTLGTVTANTGAVDLLSTAGRIDVAGAIAARTFARVDANTGAQLASVTATGTGASLLRARGGPLVVTGATSVGGALALQATGAVTTGSVRAGGALTVTAGTNAALASAASDVGGIDLSAAGTLAVAGPTTAQLAIVANSGGAQTFGDVTSRAGTVALASTAGPVTAAAVTADGALSVAGPAGVTLGSARSVNAGVTLGASAGPLTVTGPVRGRGNVGITARDAVALGAVTSDIGTVSITSGARTVGATVLTAAGAIDVAGATGVSLAQATSTGLSVALRSSGGGVAVDTVRTATTLAADAATTLSIATGAIGTDASLAGRDVALGTFGAGTLAATARGGDLTVEAGDIRGAATLTKTGATGAISIARLNAGSTQITSAGAVRADLLEGGATTVNAAGDVSGRTGALRATVASLAVSAGGAATIGAVTTTGTTSIAAAGAALLTDAITSGGDLLATGGTVTLGTAGQGIAQVATGRIGVTSTSGAITGLAGLTLRSDRGGAGLGDLTLQSAAGIAFQPGTLLAGGPDRQSALRLAAAPGAAITLDAVEARTIASPGAAASLAHTGPVTIARAATRDTLSIALTGGAPALTIGRVEVRAGNLSLDTTGALSTGVVDVAAGATTLAGATVTSGAITTRSLAATARTGAATFTTIDATAGGITATAATDLRVARATATGALALTSTTGDITGSAVVGAFDPATLTSTGGTITVRADAADGTRGVIRLASASGAGGVDLAGRTIVAESLTSSTGAVTASTRRDAAGITDQAMTIGTIDAAGTITLATGNRAAASSAPVALDRATSTGGNIAITTIGGGLAARAGSPRTTLSATAGSITLDIGGAAVLGSASAGVTTIAATSLNITTASATGGALALSTRGGPLVLGTGTASGAATIDAVGPITADTITGSSVTLTGTATATLGTVRTRSGDLVATVAGAFDAATLDSARGIAVDAGAAQITTLTAAGDARVNGTNGVAIGTATVTGGAAIRSGAGMAIGTLEAGSAALTAATTIDGNRIVTAGTLTANAGTDATLTTVEAGGDAALTAGARLRVDNIATAATLTANARRIDVVALDAGALDATAGIDGFDLRTGRVAEAVNLRSGAGIAIGTLDAGSATITATTALAADRLTTRGALTLAGRRIDVATLDTGSLRATGGLDGIDLRTASVGGLASIVSDAALAIASLDAGSADLNATTTLVADRLTGRGVLAARAGIDATLTTVTAGGDTALAAGRTLSVETVTTPAALSLASARIAVTTLGAGSLAADAGANGIDLRAANVANAATIWSESGVAIGTLEAGSAAIVAADTLAADSLTARDAMTLAARTIGITALTAGSLEADAGAGGFDLRTGTVAGVAAIASDAGLGFGTLAARSATLVAATDIGGDRLTTTGAVIATAGRDVALAIVTAGGDATLTAARTLAVGTVATPATLTLTGAGIIATTIDAGRLTVSAGSAGLTVGDAEVAGLAALTSTAGATIGTLDAGTIDIGAAGVLVADRLSARNGLSIAAGSADVETTRVTGGATRIATGAGGLVLDDLMVAGALDASTTGALTAGTLEVGGGLTASGASASLASTRVAGDAALTATSGSLRVGQAAVGGAAALGAATDVAADTLTVGRTLTITGSGIAIRQASAGGTATLTARDSAITLGEGRFAADASLTSAGALSADLLTVGTTLNARADTIALTNATVGRDATLAARTALLGTFASGGTITLTVEAADIGALTSGAATRITAQGALAATRIDAGTSIDARAGSVTIGQATARGGDVAVAATGGDIRLASATATGAVGLTATGATAVTGAVTAGTGYRVDAASIALGTAGTTSRQAGADVALTARTGAIAAQGSTTVAATRTVSLTANGASGAIGFAPDTTITSSAADVVLATTGGAALGTVTASAGAIRLGAADAVLTRPVSAQTVALTNVATSGITRLGDAGVGNETEFAAPATRFDLSNAETGLIAAPTVTIASGARDVVIGAVGLGTATGSTRFAITANGRIDMLGRFVATGSAPTRTIAVGGETAGARTGVIRIAATQGEGGRLLADGAVIELTADRIGAGLDRDFLDAIGYRTPAGLDVETVTQQYVARPTSTLYAPSALGAAPYTDGVLVRSAQLRLSYGRYALFQNTGRPGEQAGVVIGTLGAAPAPGGTLRLLTLGSTDNTFSLFGSIDGISSQATALLGPDRLSIDSTVSPVASRINGCIIGSGGGCLNTSIAQPTLNLFDTSRAEIVRTADDLTLPFDPLIGTNNEALYLDSETAAPPRDDCEGDKPCPPKP